MMQSLLCPYIIINIFANAQCVSLTPLPARLKEKETERLTSDSCADNEPDSHAYRDKQGKKLFALPFAVVLSTRPT